MKNSNVGNTPLSLGIEKGTRIPLKGKWKEQTYYVVEVAYSSTNPIHRSIFYSGFLNGKGGKPGGYNCVLSPTVDGKPSIGEYYYLKVVKILANKDLV